eukprot:4936640-Pyramimonas_sp.AAC.1
MSLRITSQGPSCRRRRGRGGHYKFASSPCDQNTVFNARSGVRAGRFSLAPCTCVAVLMGGLCGVFSIAAVLMG